MVNHNSKRMIAAFVLAATTGLAGCKSLYSTNPAEMTDRQLFAATMQERMQDSKVSEQEKADTAGAIYRYLRTESLDPAIRKTLEETLASGGFSMKVICTAKGKTPSKSVLQATVPFESLPKGKPTWEASCADYFDITARRIPATRDHYDLIDVTAVPITTQIKKDGPPPAPTAK